MKMDEIEIRIYLDVDLHEYPDCRDKDMFKSDHPLGFDFRAGKILLAIAYVVSERYEGVCCAWDHRSEGEAGLQVEIDREISRQLEKAGYSAEIIESALQNAEVF